MSVQCLSTINMVLSDEDKILLKSLYLKVYTTKRLTDEFPEKRRTKQKLFKTLTQAQFTGGQKFEFLISQGSVATRLR